MAPAANASNNAKQSFLMVTPQDGERRAVAT
jgi:hypothetical protein